MPSSTVYGTKAYLLTGDRHTFYSLTPAWTATATHAV